MRRRWPSVRSAVTVSSMRLSCRPSAHRSTRRHRSRVLPLHRTRLQHCSHRLAPTKLPAILREPMPAVATVEDVSKLYGRFVALRHVSTTLERGRCYLLLGENGAGKSTLLRVLAGLLRPTLGRVHVLGHT